MDLQEPNDFLIHRPVRDRIDEPGKDGMNEVGKDGMNELGRSGREAPKSSTSGESSSENSSSDKTAVGVCLIFNFLVLLVLGLP